MSKQNNLYKIKVKHCAPKDYHNSTEAYFIAKSDEDVYQYINKNLASDSWEEANKEIEDEDIPSLEIDDKFVEFQTYKDYILSAKGDWEDRVGIREKNYYPS